jgi:hypothetical protein
MASQPLHRGMEVAATAAGKTILKGWTCGCIRRPNMWVKLILSQHCALSRWWSLFLSNGLAASASCDGGYCHCCFSSQYLKGKHIGHHRYPFKQFHNTVHCAGGGMLAWKKLVVPFLSNGLTASASRDRGCCHWCWENNLIEVSHGLPLMFPTTAAPRRY